MNYPFTPSILIYAVNLLPFLSATTAEVVLLAAEAAPAICIAITPPNGPAGLELAILTRHVFAWPPTVPLQVVPAGIWTVKGYGGDISKTLQPPPAGK